jgi:hypothetical protein
VYRLGLALAQKGDQDGALVAYRRALAIDGGFAQAEEARKRVDAITRH